MNARRQAALLGIDPDRGRRDRKSNIVNARANAREERLNHRRRVESDDPAQNMLFAQDSNVGGAARSLEDLSGNVRELPRNNLLISAVMCVPPGAPSCAVYGGDDCRRTCKPDMSVRTCRNTKLYCY